jgi:undecaprenyl diphosphate synthase
MSQIIPKHLAFIMDGNRRWAKAHKFEILMGHNRGSERIETVVEAAAKRNIEVVTFWAFSTENWSRDDSEVSMLFTVFRNVLAGSMVKRLIKNGVKLQILGEYHAFPKDIVEGLEKLMADSKDNTRITANIALNYGGRAEILGAINEILKSAMAQERKSAKVQIDEYTFSSNLSTKDIPDPDMIIRTGGEQRLSGFLPWQAVYSELYFTDVFWPDFDEKEFEKVLEEFGRRSRRFGK